MSITITVRHSLSVVWFSTLHRLIGTISLPSQLGVLVLCVARWLAVLDPLSALRGLLCILSCIVQPTAAKRLTVVPLLL